MSEFDVPVGTRLSSLSATLLMRAFAFGFLSAGVAAPIGLILQPKDAFDTVACSLIACMLVTVAGITLKLKRVYVEEDGVAVRGVFGSYEIPLREIRSVAERIPDRIVVIAHSRSPVMHVAFIPSWAFGQDRGISVLDWLRARVADAKSTE